MAALWLASASTNAWAILGQTRLDLLKLEDQLRFRMERDDSFKKRLVPMLVAPPRSTWTESRDDFPESAMNSLRSVFGGTDALVVCPDCDTNRLIQRNDGKTVINNGELSLADLIELRKHPAYAEAKSVAVVKETPSGVWLRVIDLNDGAVLFASLADSSETLDGSRPYMNSSREMERRKMGESLSYVFLNMGIYPTPSFQAEWLEQWGPRNNHLSGIAISLLNPIFAIGGVYHYMLPSFRRANVGLGVFYPMQNMFSAGDAPNDAIGGFVLQGMLQYGVTGTFGVFAGATSEGDVSIGVNFFNPILMPFLM